MYSACRESFVERSILKRLSDLWGRSSKSEAPSDSTIRQSTFDIRHFMKFHNSGHLWLRNWPVWSMLKTLFIWQRMVGHRADLIWRARWPALRF